MMYLFQVTIYTGLMLLLYILLLRNRPNHGFNRAYLLLAAIVPLALPFLKLPQSFRPIQDTPVLNTYLNEVVVGGTATQSFSMPIWLIAILSFYIVVALVMLLVRLQSYLKIRTLINNTEKETMGKYYLLRNTGLGPGSWYNYIFLPEQDVDASIIRHEQVHIELKHSRDLLIVNLLQTLLWPNLFIHFIKSELVQIHEFQADAAVGEDKENYSKLLLSSVFGTQHLQLAHSFINHPIKRRIMMLYKNQTTGKQRGILASILSIILLAGIVTMQSCEPKNEQIVKPLDGHKDFEKIAKMPEAGYNAYKKLGENTIYPKEAMDNGIEGKILIKFVVDKDGHITDIHPVKDDYNPLLAKAAVDAVAKLPDWIPGEDADGNKVPVVLTLPLVFKLGGSAEGSFEYEAEKVKNKTKQSQKEADEAKAILKKHNERIDNPPPPPPPPTAALFQEGPLDVILYIYSSIGSRYESLDDKTKEKAWPIKDMLDNIENRFVING